MPRVCCLSDSWRCGYGLRPNYRKCEFVDGFFQHNGEFAIDTSLGRTLTGRVDLPFTAHAEPFPGDRRRSLAAAPCHLNDENSRAKFQNVREDSSAARQSLAVFGHRVERANFGSLR